MKKLIYVLMMSLGLIGFISLYILVIVFKEETFPQIKYIIMIVGYIALILFMAGVILLLPYLKKGKKENEETLL